MSDDELLDGLIEQGLSGTTLGSGIPGEVFDRIRGEMLDEFDHRLDSAVNVPRLTVVVEDAELADPIAFDPGLRSLDVQTLERGHVRTTLVSVAAALVFAAVIAVGSLAVAGRDQVETGDLANGPDAPASVAAVEFAGLQIPLPDGVEVVELNAERLMLVRTDDTKDPQASILLSTLGDGLSVEQLIDGGRNAGVLEAVPDRDRTLGVDVDRWELRLSNETVADSNCRPAEPCVFFGPSAIGLWAAAINNVVAIPAPDGTEVLWLERSTIQRDPLFDDLGRQILDGLIVVDPTPG